MKSIIICSTKFLAAPPDSSDELAPWVNPETLSYADRAAMLARVLAGELTALRFSAVVFFDAPNRNRTRPEPGRLGELAAAAAGTPLVEDHRFGTHGIVGSVLAGRVTADGVPGLGLDHEITDPETMAAFLRLQRRQFSIALDAERWTCSECNAPSGWGWFGPIFKCQHDWDTAELFGRGELAFIHDSFVGYPAVQGTGLLSAYAEAQRHGGTFFGVRPLNARAHAAPRRAATFGDALAAILGPALDLRVETGDFTRESLVDEIATATGLETDRVEEIIAGEGDLPTLEELAVFAELLDLEMDDVETAFVEDGGVLPVEDPPTQEDQPVAESTLAQTLAAAEARAQKAEARAQKAEAMQFEAAWRDAVAARRVRPAERKTYERVLNDSGAEFACRLLTGGAADASLSGAQHSDSSPGAPPADRWSLVRVAVRHGFVRQSTFDALQGGASITRAGRRI